MSNQNAYVLKLFLVISLFILIELIICFPFIFSCEMFNIKIKLNSVTKIFTVFNYSVVMLLMHSYLFYVLSHHFSIFLLRVEYNRSIMISLDVKFNLSLRSYNDSTF